MAIFLSGCFSATPFQSARVVESGKPELTTSVMRSTQDIGNFRTGWTQIELAAHNPIIGGRLELAVNGGLMVFDVPSVGGVLGAGFKVELLDDILAFELPAQFIIGGTNPLETTHFYPRIIASFPFSDAVELNLSATRYYYAKGDYDGPDGYAAGLAFGKRGEMIIRPEFGVLYYPYNEDPTYQFGIAFTPGSEVTSSSAEGDPLMESTPF